MGLIVRENTAPIANGEVADGDEVEAEFNKLFTVVNGNLDDDNISASADINGTKLLDNSVANAKLAADTITTAKMAAAAVPKAAYSTSTSTASLQTATTFGDLPSITMATVTAGSTDDIFLVDLSFDAQDAGGAAETIYGFGFSVSTIATTESDSAVVGIWNDRAYAYEADHCHITWATTAPATGAIYIKPRIKKLSGSDNPPAHWGSSGYSGTTIVFRVLCIPAK